MSGVAMRVLPAMPCPMSSGRTFASCITSSRHGRRVLPKQTLNFDTPDTVIPYEIDGTTMRKRCKQKSKRKAAACDR